jgi:membrane protein YqaA with SNARE-associated domain
LRRWLEFQAACWAQSTPNQEIISPEMNLTKIRTVLLTFVSSLGGIGLFIVAFLDSSVLTFPVINDLLVIDFSIENPARMPYYALMATLGSVGGCILLYYLARKSGEVVFRRQAGAHASKIQAWLARNEFLSVFAAAMLPPPTPFKLFVLAAGVFKLPIRTFALALLLARGLRYFGEGYLAIRYGRAAEHYIADHKLIVMVVAIALIVLVYFTKRRFFPAEKRTTD